MELRDYQKEAVRQGLDILKREAILYLALETRTGKSLISLSIASVIGKPVLFVTKKKAIPSILSDYQKAGFTFHLDVTNYEQLKNFSNKDRLVIIDEAHGTGAFPKPSLRAKQLREITKGCPVILLSATPTPESHSQIYHQLWCANAAMPFIQQYKNFYAWAKEYVTITEKRIGTGQMVKDYSKGKENQIIPMIATITITLTQAQAGFSETDIDEIFLEAPAPPRILDIAKAIKRDGIYKTEGWTATADTAAGRVSKLHQLCGGTILDDTGTAHTIALHKIPLILEISKRYPKLAIYYKFNGEGDLLRAILGDLIRETWQDFQEYEWGIYLSQFQSGREGINLSTADAILFYNMDHAYLSYEQTRNRIQKIDRDRKGLIIFIQTARGLERAIYDVVRQKENYTASHYRAGSRDAW